MVKKKIVVAEKQEETFSRKVLLPKEDFLEKSKKFNYEPYEEFVSELDKDQIKNNYKRLRDTLALSSNRESHGHLIELIDNSARSYLYASDLLLFAKDQDRKFRMYFEITEGKLISMAHKELEKKKANKEISGQITADLKKAWIVKNYEEEWNELNEKKNKIKLIRERMEDLKQAWQMRLSSLQSQAKIVEIKRQILS